MKAVSQTPVSKSRAAPEFYVPGGALNPDAPSYIPRAADEELTRAIVAGEYCYILTPRQMGKSSLMYRTADALKRENIRSVTIDLTGIGTLVTEEQWYLGHLLRIRKDLQLESDFPAWWRANSHLGAAQRFGLFLTDVALREVAEPITIFIDEIDTTLNLTWSDDYFAAIRSLHIQRAGDPELRRLRFVLLGVASPSDLIKDAGRTPFNVGRRIALGDFTLDEMAPLKAGLAPDPALADRLLKAIAQWTGGHPFLTQTACGRVARWAQSPQFSPSKVPAIVDDLVRELFISESGRNKDPNLQFVRDRILEHPRAVPLLDLYRRIRRGETITDDELDPLRAALKLSGLIVTTDGGPLEIRNRVYSTVLDDVWVSVSLERKGAAFEPKTRIEDSLVKLWEEIKTEATDDAGHHFQELLGVSECAFLGTYIERNEIADLRAWLNDDKPFAILTGGAGSGKTNLLVAFAQETARQMPEGEERGWKQLVLYFRLGRFDPQVSLLLPQMAGFIEHDLPSRLRQSVTESDLRGMIRDGRIVLILDGLDELARTKGEEAVDALRLELIRLADKATPKIVIACRDHILNRLERNVMLERRKRIQLLSIPSEEIKARLPGIPPEALGVMTETMLFYGVLSKGRDALTLTKKLGGVKSQPAFFLMLIDQANDEAGLKSGGDETLRLLGEVAARMLESRSDSIGGNKLDATCKDLVERLAKCDCKLIVEDSNGKYRFIHQAIREFILAWNIADAIADPGRNSLLTTTHCLDYESAETYFHLRSLLNERKTGMDSLVAEVDPHLVFTGNPVKWSNYLRNYFETIAMLGLTGQSLELAIRRALDVIAAPETEVLYRAKYEAARCLACLHPSAPWPLCVYVTDKEWLKSTNYSYIYGFAARGFHLRERTIRDIPPEAISKTYDWKNESELTSSVIHGLLEAVLKLKNVPELPRDAEFLYVNCSHALIRWLNPDVRGAVREVERLTAEPALRSEVRINLLMALERCKIVRRDDLFENESRLQGRRVRPAVAEAWGLPLNKS